jgi:GST-like protein
VWPWYGGGLAKGTLYNDGAEFLQVQDYKNLQRWTDLIAQRPAVKRGGMVNRAWGDPPFLPERHEASDFDVKPAE